jgi:hypothetical protein
VINEPMTTIMFSETVNQIVLVLPDSELQAVRHFDIDHSRFAGHDINEIAMALHNSRSLDCVAAFCERSNFARDDRVF